MESTRLPGWGLSPRMRGNLRLGPLGQVRHGSIPAYAGEPQASSPPRRGTGVYPRVCGGTRASSATRRTYPGLSPRMRGNLRGGVAVGGHRGSIPAYAGEPGCRRGIGGPWRVYPRVCGGTYHVESSAVSMTGLSPRMRGNLEIPRSHVALGGSIPAYAGEPAFSLLLASPERVYPRVCGGTFGLRAQSTRTVGLSPRMRGNPAPRPRRGPRKWVYPRVCGGTGLTGARRRQVRGLSPRMRGNRIDRRSPPAGQGSIPAYAGEPPAGPFRWGP